MSRFINIASLVLIAAAVCAYGQLPGPATQTRQNLAPAQRPAPAATENHIPAFLQAGRWYVFQPTTGEAFPGRVISIDATGWVQLQRRPGAEAGPVSDWYNL